MLLALAAPAWAQAPAQGAAADSVSSGKAVFDRACAACHGGSSNAPTPDTLRTFTPESIVNALTNGRMQQQGSTLSPAERAAVAGFLAGRAPASTPAVASAPRCTASPAVTDVTARGSWNGWGGDAVGTRFAEHGGLTASDLPNLKLKWAFGFQGVSRAASQPMVAGGRLFVASENGEVHALDPRTGCTHWTYKAQSGVRNALIAGPYKNATGSGIAVFFGDARANAYAVDATTGREIWIRKVDDHPQAAITGGFAVANGRVFVPVQGIGEEGQGGRGGYACCTFRGSLSALDASTGAVAWKQYMVGESQPRAKNKDGMQMYGPAGGGIWSAPTIDSKRGFVYVATGNGYADPAQPLTDAVVALDMATGRVRWVNQTTKDDQWTLGCPPQSPDNPACPRVMGPDHDFSASPILATANGRDLVVVPQKSGMMFAFDPDNEGRIVWQQRIGQGSGLGGQWGAAVDGRLAYSGVSDLLSPTPGGIRALNLADGKVVWSVGPQTRLCNAAAPTCRASQGAAVTAIPGAVLSGSLDGGLRAYSSAGGAILWQFNSNQEFQTVNGVKANGGGLEGSGPVVAGGMLFFTSGYGGFIGNAGNVLLAFGVD